jgi:hypothetical protein
VPGAEQDVEQLVAELGIGLGAPEILDHEGEEAVPSLERQLPAAELLGAQGGLGCPRGGWRRWDVQRDVHLDAVRLDGEADRPQRVHRRRQPARPRERHEGALQLLDRRAEVVAERRQRRLGPALHRVPDPRRHAALLAVGVVELGVDHAESEAPVGRDLGLGQDLDEALPAHRRQAVAEGPEPRLGLAGTADAEPAIDRLELGVAQDEAAAAVGAPPEHDLAAGIAQVLAESGLEEVVLDGEREPHLGGLDPRRQDEPPEPRGERGHPASHRFRV